ncbi:hypothetical protein [Cellulomonas palmilytica]|uniref:hypothetical protein n=1 Tax=Cellulomonas palmilytica TaxID=2608402 RepID=UPI001F31798E|nr:hypothetical protein [Cellulomonas palmilytica]UJP39978.1 hypothetical protein F1D97_17205 [Cellulomonas palmilytica]
MAEHAGRRDAGTRRSAFLAVDRGSVVRLVVTVLLGLAALVGPRLTPTSAQFTDTVEVPVTLGTASDFAVEDPPTGP